MVGAVLWQHLEGTAQPFLPGMIWALGNCRALLGQCKAAPSLRLGVGGIGGLAGNGMIDMWLAHVSCPALGNHSSRDLDSPCCSNCQAQDWQSGCAFQFPMGNLATQLNWQDYAQGRLAMGSDSSPAFCRAQLHDRVPRREGSSPAAPGVGQGGILWGKQPHNPNWDLCCARFSPQARGLLPPNSGPHFALRLGWVAARGKTLSVGGAAPLEQPLRRSWLSTPIAVA